jgi:hypothetical protein
MEFSWTNKLPNSPQAMTQEILLSSVTKTLFQALPLLAHTDLPSNL